MTADRNDTRKRLNEVAAEHGLAVGTWSPGDGATRYRFIDSYDAAGNITVHPGELDYFGANGDRQMYTALGLTEAWVWLRGVHLRIQHRRPARLHPARGSPPSSERRLGTSAVLRRAQPSATPGLGGGPRALDYSDTARREHDRMALYVIRARESGHYLESATEGEASFWPHLSTHTRTYNDETIAALIAHGQPFACDVLELRPVYRDEAAQ